MEDKEYLKFLEERNEKLLVIESMISKLQYNANDKDTNRLDLNDLKMEVFKLWYFQKFNKKWEDK